MKFGVVSDGHLGATVDPAKTSTALVHVDQVMKGNRVDGIVFNGDAVLGSRQIVDFPDYETHLRAGAAMVCEWHGKHKMRVAGNTELECRNDVPGMDDQTLFDAYEDKGHIVDFADMRAVINHANMLEPSAKVLKRNAVLWLLGPLRNNLEKLLSSPAAGDTAPAVDFFSRALEDDFTLSDDLYALDHRVHNINCDTNANLNQLLSRFGPLGSLLRSAKDTVIPRIMVDVYIRSYISVIQQLLEEGILKNPPKILAFGHIHEPFLFNQDQLRARGIEGRYLPDYMMNTGTAVPFPKEHNGYGGSHCGIIDSDSVPELWQTFDAKNPHSQPRCVNRGGVIQR